MAERSTWNVRPSDCRLAVVIGRLIEVSDGLLTGVLFHVEHPGGPSDFLVEMFFAVANMMRQCVVFPE